MPSSGNTLLYIKSDGKVYTKDNLGVETQIGAGGGGTSGTAMVTLAATAQYSSAPTGLAAIDGITPIAGDTVLIWKQDAPYQSYNGIWTAATGAWTRTPAYDTLAKMAGLVVAVGKGTSNGGKVFLNANKSTDVLGSQNARFRATAIPTGSGSNFYGQGVANEGQLLFDTTAYMLKYYDGTAWRPTNGVLYDTNTNRLSYEGGGNTDRGLVWMESDTGRIFLYDSGGVAREFALTMISNPALGASPPSPAAGLRWYYPPLMATLIYDGTQWIVDGKATVRVASTANINGLSGNYTIDGVPTAAGDLILVKNQTTPSSNGIWYVKSGSWVRIAGADTTAGILSLGMVTVREGVTQTGSRWTTDFPANGTVGTTNMNWYMTYSELDPPAGTNPNQVNLTTDWTSTSPATPATGVSMFARFRAGRRLPAYQPVSGLDSPLQPGLAFNKVAWATAPGNSTTLPSLVGFNTASPLGTVAARNVATTNFSTQTKRVAYQTAATAAALCEWRQPSGQYFLSNVTSMGGFYAVFRFINDTNASTGDRMFVGMAPVAAATNVEPSSVFNILGTGFDAADTNFQLMKNGASGTATKTNLGANFAKATTTNVYELRIFSAPGTQTAHMSMDRLDINGAVVESLNQTTFIPTSGTLLAPKIWKSNNATAAVSAFAFISIYIETDN